MRHRRIELLLDAAVTKDLDRIAVEADTTRSFLIRKAVRLYLAHRRPEGRRPDNFNDLDRAWFPDDG